MKKTEPWWVCDACGEPVVRVGKGARQKMLDHRKKHERIAFYGIKQIEQSKNLKRK